MTDHNLSRFFYDNKFLNYTVNKEIHFVLRLDLQ